MTDFPPRPPSGGGSSTRERVIKEIIDTEEDYIRDLEIIIKVYLLPMREQGIATKDQINNIFSNVEVLYQINRDIFLPELKGASISQAFLSVLNFLKMYSVYCGNQDLAVQTLSALKENPKAEQFLFQCSRKPECRSLDLASFLIKPVQRICKYPLLLRELLHHTPEDQPEHASLSSALQGMKSMVDKLNEKKSDLDKKMRLYELSSKLNLKGDIHLMDTPNRRLLSEGEITRLAPKELLGKKLVLKTQGYYFLFSDLFLFTKPTSSSYEVKVQVDLSRALYKDSDMAEDAFELVHLFKKSTFFAAASTAKKTELKRDIEASIAPLLGKRYSKFVQKEIAKTLSMQVSPVNLDAPIPDDTTLPPAFTVPSFDDWRHKLEEKVCVRHPDQDNWIRFLCNSPAPDSEKKVIKLAKNDVTLAGLNDQIRKKFNIAPTVNFKIVYPNNDGSWEMHPVNEQQDLDQCLEKKISDLFFSWA